jgi:hypothetical protein
LGISIVPKYPTKIENETVSAPFMIVDVDDAAVLHDGLFNIALTFEMS